MHKKTTAFQCWSCGMKGNAITFLAELENVSPIQAAIWIKERFNIGTVPKQESIVDNVKEILSKKKATKTPSYSLPELDESEADRRVVDWNKLWKEYNSQTSQLNELPGTTWEDIFQKQPESNPLFYMFDRGFKPETLVTWKIGWDKISERISIPVRNENGRLVGFKGRTIKKENPRYLVLGGIEYGFEPYETKKVLFGLSKITQDSELIVREGELNVISLHEKGIRNSVGISGKVLSNEQINLCKKYSAKLIMWFDDEEDARSAAEKIKTIPTIVVPSFERDPVEMTRGEILSHLTGTKFLATMNLR
jgi:DNA primase